jgi:hypothetical protein
MNEIHIQLEGEPVLKGKEAYEPDDLCWSIYSDTTPKDVDDWVEANNVGFTNDDEEQRKVIDNFEDGEYGLILSNYEETESISSDGRVAWKRMEHVYYISTNKVIIKDGLVDVDSVKEATAELLNRCGYWGTYIEALWEVDFDIGLLDRTKFIRLALGS